MEYQARRTSVAVTGALFVETTIFVAACGGGGGGAGSPIMTHSTATPSGSASVVNLQIAFADVGPFVAFCCLDTISVDYTVPPNDQSSTKNTFALSFSKSPLSGLPALSSTQRRPQSISPSGGTAAIYFSVTSPVPATFAFFPLQGVDFGNSVAGDAFYLAVYDPTNVAAGWQTIGPCANTGTGAIFPGTDTPYTIKAGAVYGIALYFIAGPTPPPPSPSPSP